jgi:hypothetical protein
MEHLHILSPRIAKHSLFFPSCNCKKLNVFTTSLFTSLAQKFLQTVKLPIFFFFFLFFIGTLWTAPPISQILFDHTWVQQYNLYAFNSTQEWTAQQNKKRISEMQYMTDLFFFPPHVLRRSGLWWHNCWSPVGRESSLFVILAGRVVFFWTSDKSSWLFFFPWFGFCKK